MKRLPFAYSYSMPHVALNSFDYAAMSKAAGKKDFDNVARDSIFRALTDFLSLCWGSPPSSESVRESLEQIGSTARDAADALGRLFSAYCAANSAAQVMLSDETGERMEDYFTFRKQSRKYRTIADCAAAALQRVPSLPRGNPGKLEFHALVLALHGACDLSWYSESENVYTRSYRGAFVSFVCETVRQLKPYLRGARVRCWPENVDVSTDRISKMERRAIGRAIKAVKQGQEIP